jgi:membrane protease YdiL (CAAX protease family)
MSDGEEEKEAPAAPTTGLWRRVPVWLNATLVGVLVSSIGVFTWAFILALIPAPWSIAIMGILLWIYLKYFSGSWWPKTTTQARKLRFRAVKMPREVWRWSIVCALLLVALWQSSLVVTFRLVEFPADVVTAGYNVTGLPIWVAWLMVIMAALVAGICEETGYRGYMQVPIEGRHGSVRAIALVSTVFLAVHLPQVWAPPLLFHLFAVGVLLGTLAYASGSLIPGMIAHFGLDIFNFSYWWTDVAGRFNYRPISETGPDGHFAAWAIILIASAGLFIFAIRKTKAVRVPKVS